MSSSSSTPTALQLRAQSLRSPFRTDILAGQVALITGGASGIGLEIARQLGLHGAKVALMGRRAEVLEAARVGLEAQGVKDVLTVRGDVRSAEDAGRAVSETVSGFGCLSLLVNSAAGNFLSPAEDLSPKGFNTVMQIDTLGVFTMAQAAFPALKARGDSLIINISAMLHQPATWFQAHASAAKAAIDSLTRSLALEWGEYGIRVTGIAPGPIGGTAGMDKLAAGVSEEVLSREVPLRRFGRTLDIALTAVFLASDAATYVTGETIVVDGGSWLFKPQLASRETIRSFSRATEKKQKQAPVGVLKAKL